MRRYTGRVRGFLSLLAALFGFNPQKILEFIGGPAYEWMFIKGGTDPGSA